MKHIYFNTKKESFEELNISRADYRIKITKDNLDKNITRKYQDESGAAYYVASINGTDLIFQRLADELVDAEDCYRVFANEEAVMFGGAVAFVYED